MKKILGSLAVLCLMGTGIQAYAMVEASTNTEVRTTKPNLPIRADIKANRETLKTEIEASRASTIEMREDKKNARASTSAFRKDAHRERVEKNIHLHADRMTKHLTAAVERFEKITARLDSRISKMKAEGKSTINAERFEAEAKVSIASAKSSVATIPNVLETALAQDRLIGSFGELEKLTVSIRTNLISAQKSLISAVESLMVQNGNTHVETNTSIDASVQ